MQPWKTLAKRVVLHYDKFLTVEEHTIQLSNGQVIADWPWVIMPDYINVVVVTAEGAFLCFRQTKYAVDGETLALVGGYLEPGEDPLQAAQRELLEETGFQAAEWMPLGSWAVDANRGAGAAHAFLATGAHRITEPTGGDLEEQELLYLSREEVEAALTGGAFRVLPWSNALALALRLLPE
jgi:ADP-ribose pyrophosphatase